MWRAPGAAWLDQRRKERMVRLRKENKQWKLEREILAKAAAGFARETESIHPSLRVVSANQAVYPIGSVSRVLGVLPSGFYAWRKRPPSKPEQADDMLTQEIKKIHQKSKALMAHRVSTPNWAEQGWHGGRKRVRAG